MESEKVKEIKKALENCQKNNCLDCPYFIDEKRCRANDLLLDTIKLINELESENDGWQEKEGALSCDLEIISEKLTNAEIEVDDYKDRIAELEKEKTCVWEEWTDGDHSIWCCSNCKEDFCFMEGDVYENNYGYCPHCGAKITALKELKEEDIKEFI